MAFFHATRIANPLIVDESLYSCAPGVVDRWYNSTILNGSLSQSGFKASRYCCSELTKCHFLQLSDRSESFVRVAWVKIVILQKSFKLLCST